MSKNNVVLPNKRQEHLPETRTLVHRSTEFVRDSDGRLVYDDKGRMKVISHTLNYGRPKSPTPKERAKATKAMMEARRRDAEASKYESEVDQKNKTMKPAGEVVCK